MSDAVGQLARQVASALESADPQQFAALLDPNVTWGAPGDPAPPCRNRQQVLAWYLRGRDEGRRATVRRTTVHGDKIIVSMTVTSESERGERSETPRWQVLTVRDGRIADIRGYDDETAASAAAGPPD